MSIDHRAIAELTGVWKKHKCGREKCSGVHIDDSGDCNFVRRSECPEHTLVAPDFLKDDHAIVEAMGWYIKQVGPVNAFTKLAVSLASRTELSWREALCIALEKLAKEGKC